MAPAIPDEAIDKFRRLEARAEAARALSESLRHKVDYLRNEESGLRVNLHDFYHRAAVKGRIEITDDGTVNHVINGQPFTLATANPTAARLKRTEAAIARARAEQAEHRESTSPILALVAACRQALVQRGWDGL